MAFQPTEGSEPIPGYRLVQRLGAGGFGEVWKVTAPGGLLKALKLVYGRMDESRADRELKALERVKVVRHPFVLSLERVEVVGNQLLVVTELADMSLHDRFNQCRAEGQRGIPREELLGHLHDAADGLDYLREHHDLQHLDIKPRNLLIVGGRIKVADFGQVKGLTGTSVTATGGATPVYAPPEVFDGRISRQSDQYSLAIVYQELLTGQRPFPGQTTLQLAAQHTNNPPLLDPLPPHDRPIISRALAKHPDARYGSCREMVAALIAAAPTATPPDALPPHMTPPPPARTPVPETPQAALDAPTQVGSVSPLRLAQHLSPTPPQRRAAGPTTAVFVGVGGLAGRVLRQLRSCHDGAGGTPAPRILLLDTDRTALHQMNPLGEGLAAEETLLLPLHRPEDYRERTPQLLHWIDRRWLYGIPRSLLTEGVRALGRLALVDNAEELLPRLRTLLAAPEDAPNDPVWVVLVASSGGGTGGGMFLDLGYLLRRVLAQTGRPVAGVDAFLLHATGQKPAARDLARVNTLACLRELSHFARPEMAHPGEAALGLGPTGLGELPFTGCMLLHLGDGLDERRLDAAADNVARYLHLAASAPVLRPSASGPWPPRSAGMTRISFPRASVARRAAALYCADVLRRWCGSRDPGREETPPGPRPAGPLAGWEAELQGDRLLRYFYEEARKAMGDELTVRHRKLQTSRLSAHQLVAQFLTQMEDYLGAGAAPDDGPGPAGTPPTAAVRERAGEVVAELVAGVTASLTRCVEDPAGRLLAAERAARELADRVSVNTAAVRTRLAQVRTRRIALRAHLLGGAGRSGKKDSGVAWLARLTPGAWALGTAAPDGELGGAVAVRLEEIALDNALVVLGQLLPRFREWAQELALCRQTLTRLSESFAAEGARPYTLASPPALTELYPAGAGDPTAAADALLRGLPSGAVARFDAMFQAAWLEPRGGLWRVASKGGELAELAQDLRDAAAGALADVVAGVDVCRCLYEGREAANEVLRTHAREAAPVLVGGAEELVLGVPSGDAGMRVRDTLLHLLARDTAVTVLTGGDVLILRHAPCPPPHDATALTANDPALTELSRKVWSRLDVPWSQ